MSLVNQDQSADVLLERKTVVVVTLIGVCTAARPLERNRPTNVIRIDDLVNTQMDVLIPNMVS